jgi:tagatose 1,6-diphosphate aldolase
MFEFHNPGKLIDKELELVLAEQYLGNPTINYVPSYRFKMVLVAQNEAIGNIELRVGNTNHIVMYAGNFAYDVEPKHRGHRYAARACKLLLPLARIHDLSCLWITCNPDNTASKKTCEIVGAQLVEIVDLPENIDMYQEGERQKCRYRLDLQ